MLSRRVDQTNNKQQHNFTPSSKVLGVKAEKILHLSSVLIMMVLHLMTSAVLIMMVKLAIVSLASADRKLSTQEIVTRGKGTKNVSLLLIRMELPDHLLSWEMEREKLWMMPNRPKHGGFLCRSFLLADTVWPSSKLSRIDIGGACRLVLRGSRYWSLSWMWRHILRHICR